MTRQERIEELIRKETSAILREKVADPRIGFVSVTEVDISPDLKNASIYVSVFGDENNKQDAMAGLNSAAGFIQRELGQILALRLTPHIQFFRDDSLERGSRVLNLISKIKNEENTGRHKKSAKKR
jgi:ribosome-binding factor A